MEHQLKPNRWSCMATAFAMAIDRPVEDVFVLLGHDGGDIVFPHLPDPTCRRGVHVQELIGIALDLGLMASPYELVPASMSPCGSVFYIDNPCRKGVFEDLVNTYRGILTGAGRRCNHAVAFEGGRVFDPDGPVYDFQLEACERKGFFPQCVWTIHG